MVSEKLYSMCNTKGYFTCGSNKQYSEMFDMAKDGASAHDIALVIWICSDGKQLDEIERDVEEALR